MFDLHCFRVPVTLGRVITKSSLCVHLEARATSLRSGYITRAGFCRLKAATRAAIRADTFAAQGAFTLDSAKEFDAQRVPSAKDVYGRCPSPDKKVSSFAATYPPPLCKLMAAGSLAAARGSAPVIPARKKLQGLAMARWTCEDGLRFRQLGEIGGVDH